MTICNLDIEGKTLSSTDKILHLQYITEHYNREDTQEFNQK